ncbi:PREDICTED: serum albumin-like [Miniopterus natalensis]|uniref:serum albumin-like n=1 Tax=Miniopterus natalensis TaxID=291302 RepID=UPI0007A6EC5B|nr:PREDICTED: serum albumin-like [Miniopterus natalensis]
MKGVTFICILFLVSSASSRGLFRRDAPNSQLGHRYKDLGEEHFKSLMLVAFSQILRKSTLDEILKLTNEITDFAKGCAHDQLAENVCNLFHTTFAYKLCSVASLRASYGDMADCCEKQEPEINECFLRHKDDKIYFPITVIPEPDAMCTAVQKSEQKFLEQSLYEVARRNPYFYGPELLYYAQEFIGDLTKCCEAADKVACLGPKISATKKNVLSAASRENFKCSILHAGGESALREWFLVRLSQKFSCADFMTVSKLVTDLTKTHKECCQSDLLGCADDRADLAKYMCENQTSISSKLAECCNKPVLEKSHCLAEMAGDNSVTSLVPLTTDFVENKDGCKNYMEAKDVFLDKFLHEFSRRHPDYSVSLILRLAKAYEATLEKCCATGDDDACYSKVLDELQPLVDKPQELMHKNCEIFEKVGWYGFQNALLIRYTKKLPHLSTPTLVDLSHKLADMGSKCCKLPESQRTACSEDNLSSVVNELCLAHEKTPVSNRVTKCCTESLENRLPCFSSLELDETYVPKVFRTNTFTFHANVCTLSEFSRQVQKQTLLVELLKHKPKATDEKLKTVTDNFSAFLQKCCAAADKEACFSEEGPKLVASSQAVLA